MRDAALDCGGLCADLLTEGLAFVGMPGKLLFPRRDASVQSSTTKKQKAGKRKFFSHCPEPISSTAGVRSELAKSWKQLQVTLNVNAAGDWVVVTAGWPCRRLVAGFSGCDDVLGQNPHPRYAVAMKQNSLFCRPPACPAADRMRGPRSHWMKAADRICDLLDYKLQICLERQ